MMIDTKGCLLVLGGLLVALGLIACAIHTVLDLIF